MSDNHHLTTPKNDDALRRFLQRYPPKSYRPGAVKSSTELNQVSRADGLMYLNDVPATAPRGAPRISQEDRGENCHLWVIDERGRPCISEAPLPRLGSGWLHHTNLTGGGKASVGGEVWFDEMPRIYLSGSSGRYPPESASHLKEAEQLFKDVGFEVLSLGWDEEAGRPRRVWHEQERTEQR